ncbi:MAG TPA: LON peptidase substrate-binding domain-containing protein, partial [Anaerolineae bacterium]|nr:LON peptidase substrate-binding domain-containing protein [Anaerolineae bacterium]
RRGQPVGGASCERWRIMYNDGMETLSLFPLNTVLFPGQLLPLQIFEPRYRQMIGECIQHGRAFGVVLIRSGEEVGDVAEPYEVGTTAHIVQVEGEADGRMNILCVGKSRFRIARLWQDKPYLHGQVELWPWEPYRAGRTAVERVRRRLDRYLQVLAETADSKLELSLPEEPAALAHVAASILQIEVNEKQRLLTTPSIGVLLNDIAELLQRELRAWQIVQASRQLSPHETSSFSLN